MVSPRREEDHGPSTITGLSYKRIEDYTKDLDRSKNINELNGEIQTDRYGFIVHEANENVQSKEIHLPIEIVQKREMKWLSMMKSWETYMKSKSKREKIKERCRKGIPSAIRGRAWQLLTGAIKRKEKESDVYGKLAEKESPEWEHTIWKDVPRTFPYHELYIEDKGPGQTSLFRVLKAYSLYNPDVGYSQALSPIVAVLLMHMTEEESFWALVSICDNYLQGYFGKKLESVQLDCLIFSSLLERTYPYISNHFRKHGIDPAMYIVEWMMCVFSRTLPFATALRVWDIFFCEGVKMLFRTALSVLKVAFPTEKSLLLHDDDYDTIQRVNNIAREDLHETVLIPLALSLKLTKNDLKKLHADALSKRPDLAITNS
ncbi:TBC1 domain family member 10A-like [Rhopilema esculentum]|uniref:TBC1 domain family member 10A-like n=1 Tax=Rhopilema esculentum TaxID=499914 RepID=UPI0031D98937